MLHVFESPCAQTGKPQLTSRRPSDDSEGDEGTLGTDLYEGELECGKVAAPDASSLPPSRALKVPAVAPLQFGSLADPKPGNKPDGKSARYAPATQRPLASLVAPLEEHLLAHAGFAGLAQAATASSSPSPSPRSLCDDDLTTLAALPASDPVEFVDHTLQTTIHGSFCVPSDGPAASMSMYARRSGKSRSNL